MDFRSSNRRRPAAWSNQNEIGVRRYDKIQELEIELEDSNTDREKEVLLNEIDTLGCVLGHLLNLKHGGDGTRAIGIAEVNNNFQQARRLRDQINKLQDVESGISAQIQN